MYLNITGLSVGMGLATAMDTLCTQAYGAKKRKLLSIYFQRGLWILSIALIPITIVSVFSGSILIMLGQNEEVSKKAGHFVTLSILCLPSLYLYELLRKMLQAMNIMMPMLLVAAVSNIFNVALCYYLVSETSLGYIGAAVARSVSCVFMPLCLLVYIKLSNAFECIWDGWNLAESLKDWKSWIQIGMGGALSMCLEWWAFEILGLLAGLLPEATTEIGANAIMFNTTAVTYMFYLGVSIASTVRVGNGLGEGNQKAVRRSALASLVINAAIGIILGSIVCVGVRARSARISLSHPLTQSTHSYHLHNSWRSNTDTFAGILCLEYSQQTNRYAIEHRTHFGFLHCIKSWMPQMVHVEVFFKEPESNR